MSKVKERGAAMEREHYQFMEVWFWATDTTMDDFADEVERLQPGLDPSDFAGLHAEIGMKIFEMGFGRDWAILIHRAMQHFAITRPWRRRSPVTPQMDLFA